MQDLRQVETAQYEGVHIDTSLIPDYVRDELAREALEFFHTILNQPDVSKAIEKRIAERRVRLTKNERSKL